MGITSSHACEILKLGNQEEMVKEIKMLPVESLAELYVLARKSDDQKMTESMTDKVRGTEILNGRISDRTAIYLIGGLQKIASKDV